MTHRLMTAAILSLCLAGCFDSGSSSDDSAATDATFDNGSNPAANPNTNPSARALSWGSTTWGEGATWTKK